MTKTDDALITTLNNLRDDLDRHRMAVEANTRALESLHGKDDSLPALLAKLADRLGEAG